MSARGKAGDGSHLLVDDEQATQCNALIAEHVVGGCNLTLQVTDQRVSQVADATFLTLWNQP